jgi:hypothetical protein
MIGDRGFSALVNKLFSLRQCRPIRRQITLTIFLLRLLQKNFRLLRRQRCERVRDVDQIARLIEQKPAFPFIASRLARSQLNGAPAVGVGAARARFGEVGSLRPNVLRQAARGHGDY